MLGLKGLFCGLIEINTSLFCENVFESLGLGWWEILFHTVNLLILIIALRFLLFKPVKRMIENHKKKLADVVEKNKELEEESAAVKAKYDKMMDEAKIEAAKISAEVTKNAQRKSEEIIDDANRQAKNILDNAKRETLIEQERLKNDLKETVSVLAVDIAEKVLQREIDDSDNEKIIDECLKEWEEK
ncbi:MAG: F0F1 ATP synthase subunit B [Clostridia bacterium]|nr:F0F1 ATP synthase subunit B [Clostridia bacterium]